MSQDFSLAVAPRVFFRPREVFLSLARARPSAAAVFWRYALWIGILPPLAAAVGSAVFGWRLGIGEPILFSARVAAFIGGAYFVALLAGFLVASCLTKWMAATYGAESSFGLSAGLVAVVGTPLAAGGVLHLYPQAGINLLALIPAIVWSAYLLYAGLPGRFRTRCGARDADGQRRFGLLACRRRRIVGAYDDFVGGGFRAGDRIRMAIGGFRMTLR